MELPYMKGSNKKRKSQTIVFGGLNVTDTAKAGELRSSRNLSSDRFPYMAPRAPRATYKALSNPSALFDWNGLVYVEGTDLFYNDAKVGVVSAGAKQFAVVNTKLVIWPDKMYLDLMNNKFKPLAVSLTSEADDAVFTQNSIQTGIASSTGTGTETVSYEPDNITLIKTYATASWSSGDGWTTTGQDEIPVVLLNAGDIIIPSKVESSGAYVLPLRDDGEYPDENDDGTYYVVTGKTNTPKSNYRWAVFTITGYTYYNYGEFDQYDIPIPHQGVGLVAFQYFLYGITGTEHTSGIYPPIAVLPREDYVRSASTFIAYEIYKDSENNNFTDFLKPGDVVIISGCTTYPGNNIAAPEKPGDTMAKLSGVTSGTLTFVENIFTAGAEAGAVTVSKYVPDFEFICAHDNRLWGVKDKIIFASALGDPSVFYDFSGLSTDSYQVAVGSKGEFTGCFSSGGEVLFFKEDLIHRILGNIPAEYSLTTDMLPGLQAGSHKSMAMIDENLYYKSRNGIYVYSGGASNLVSYALGTAQYGSAAGGTDGIKYYISMADAAGAWNLFVYDTRKGVWHKEDETHVSDFTRSNGILYFLDLGAACIRIANVNATEVVSWEAALVEFTESILNKKDYTWLYVKVELGDASILKIEASIDGRPYRQVYLTHNKQSQVLTIPLPPYRCDELKLRFSGTGPCAVKAIEREYVVGSER